MTFEIITIIALVCSAHQSLPEQRACQKRLIECVEGYKSSLYAKLSSAEKVAECVKETP